MSEDNPYLELVQQDNQTAIRQSLQTAVDKQPDTEAKLQALAKQYSLPVEAVRLEQPDVERRAKLDAVDYGTLAKQYPATGALLSDQQKAALAHDDIDNLTQLEAGFRALRGPTPTTANVASGLLANLSPNQLHSSIKLALHDAFNGNDSIESQVYRNDLLRKSTQEQAALEATTPDFESATAQGVYSGAASFVQAIPGLALSIASGNPAPMLASAGLNTALPAYTKYSDRGASKTEAAIGAIGEGAVEVGFEALPMGYLVKNFGKVGAGQFLTGLLAREVPTEQATTLAQNAIDTAIANPDKSWGDFAKEVPDAAYQTLIATLTQGGITGAISSAAKYGAERSTKSQSAEQQAVNLEQINTLMAASKVAQRSPDAMKSFVDAALDNTDANAVYIDAATFAQSGVAEQISAALPDVAQQLQAALASGGEIKIPMSDYVTKIAGTEYAQPLLDHIRLEGEEFSRAGAQQYMTSHADEIQAEFDRVLSTQADSSKAQASSLAVKINIKEQLAAVSRFTDKANDHYATLHSTFYSVQADKLGKTAEELFNQYPVNVNASGLFGGKVLSQGSVNDIYQTNDIDELTNLPLNSDGTVTVYHHTSAENAAKIKETGTLKAKAEPDVYVTTRKETDTGYGDTAVAIRVNPELLQIDDEFPDGRTDYRIDAKKPGGSVKVIVGEASNKVFNQGNDTQRGAFNPATRTITLLEKADLSTFLHESGHFFLEMQFDLLANLQKENELVGTEPAQMQLIKDTQALLDWFGVESLDQWYSLDFEEKRSYHEKFAEAFEKYLFEGNAPSLALSRVFASFRQWMQKVYEHIRDHFKNVELTDEVRGVFDRMLATDEEIQLAQQGRSMMPLFADMEKSGMSPEAYAEYQAAGKDATNTAMEQLALKGLRDMQWLHNAKSRELKKLQRQHDELRREIRAGVRMEVMSQPVYQAWAFLTRKLSADDKIAPAARKKSDANTVDATQDSLFTAIAKLGGLNIQELVDEWGYDDGGKIKAPVFGKPVARRNGGKSLETMAEMLMQEGYITEDEHGKHDLWEFEEKFNEELRGNTQYSMAVDGSLFAEEGKAGEQIANLAGLAAGRIELVELQGMGLDEAVVNRLIDLKMTARDGLHPDLISDIVGFSSGDEMVKALAAARPPKAAIEALTDERMLQNYGELATPDAINRAADMAIHNDVRARFVTTEANALAQATGSLRLLGSAAKEFAAGMINRLKVRDISPAQYTRAEVKSAKAALAAEKSGKLDIAAAEKRNQVINVQATRAAYDAQDDVEAGLRYFRKIEDSKTIDPDYMDQIHAVLERFDLRKVTNKEINRRTSLATWLKEQEQKGLEPDIPPEIANDAFRVSYKDLTVEEFRGLVDTVKQIEHLGRLKNKLLTATKNRNFDQVKVELIESIEANAGTRKANTRTPSTKSGKRLQSIKNFIASHIKVAALARVLDGGKDGGPVWEYFVRSANTRGEFEVTRRAEATKKLSEILAPVFKLGKMNGKGQHFPTIDRSLNREQRLAMALNTGNDGNLSRLLEGEGWTLSQISPVLQTLTAEEWNAVQQIWDYFETYRPEIGEKERRVYGKEPNWVEPKPVIVSTKNADGESVELQLRGGYYPIKFDALASQRAEQHSDAESAKRQLQGAYTSTTTRRSFTKTRKEQVIGLPLLYSMEGIYAGVNEVIHDLAWHEWLIDTNKLLGSKSIDRAIRSHYGPETVRQFKTWQQDIAGGDVGAANAGEIALGRLRQGISAAGLGFNAMSAAMQVLGFNQSIVRIGPAWVGRGISQFIANPKTAFNDVNEKSEFMRNRSRTQFRELNELRNRVQDETPMQAAIRAGTFAMMMKAQRMVDVPTWLGAYAKALADIDYNDEERAIALADQSVIDAQGSGETKDLSAIERGGQAQRLFTVFYSFMNTAFNLGVMKTMTEKHKGKLAADYLMLYTVPAVLGYALKSALTPGEGDDWDDWEGLSKILLAAQIDYLMGLMVVVREFSETAKIVTGANDLGRDYQGPAGLRLIADSVKLGQQVHQGDFDDGFRKATINLLGDVTGLPAAQTNRTITGAQALNEGKTENPAALVFGYRK